ncbi:nucleoside-diphosphate-sugar epimerase [Cryptococcus deuterogattii LA55]|nr:nucleoside-diphosphate-sugar epimerase [Cryptococcus deuterogattii LA55]KIR35857.1 nucleoside-diphosphate-sugar epimerase [Cryptococcus deuterogattii MMRL2647]KIR72588.1 nucleoside-diphosphate-sugar epimerase [Cryptococcus deuterogattii CA1014]KIR95230.1 nucleoside-diphosphate-sugar epimerase [Cryptococcus deuterogattii CBS 10090]
MTAVNGFASGESNVVLITGAAGWLGGILAGELLSDPKTPNVHLILADIAEPKAPKGAKHVITRKADLTNKEEIEALFNTEFGVPDTVYCFHGIMSRGSEDNFDLGLKVNIDSIRMMLETARKSRPVSGEPIKFIFTSSLAVYGGPLPHVVDIHTIATPEGAYGMGKLSSELLVNEYTRRGLVDGRILRLPTIVVRPGVPSAATSAFISGIIREPLHGVEAICPVGDSLESKELDAYLPGFTVTVREELEALEKVAGPEALKLIKFKDDPINRRIVGSWPARFDNSYPCSLGFVADEGGMVPVVQRFKEMVEAGLA